MQENYEVLKLNLREIEYYLKFLNEKQQKQAISKVFDKFNELKQTLKQNIKKVNKKARLWKTFTTLNIIISAICMFITYFNFAYIGFALGTVLLGFGTWKNQKDIEKNKQVYLQAEQELNEKIKEFEIMANQLTKEMENISENKNNSSLNKLTKAPIVNKIKNNNKSLNEKEL